jgi:hypothetical protein
MAILAKASEGPFKIILASSWQGYNAAVPDRCESATGRVTRASPVQTAVRNCTKDEGRSFGFGNQVLISSHRKLLRLNVVVVSVAETPGR